MLVPHALTGIVAVDRDAMTVTAAAGMQLKHFNAELEQLGLSLHNMGDVAEQTLAGAISTGTHGTGGIAAGLAAQVVGLELVTGTGRVVRASAEGELRRPRDGPRRARRARDPDQDHVRGRAAVPPRGGRGADVVGPGARELRRDDGRAPPRRHVLVPAHRPDADQAQLAAGGAGPRGPAGLRLPALARRRLPVQHGVRRGGRRREPRAAGDPADEPAQRLGARRAHLLRRRAPGLRHRATRGVPGDGVRRAARGRAVRAEGGARRSRGLRPRDQLPRRDPGRPRRRRPAVHGAAAATPSTSPSTPTAGPTTRRTSP